MCAAWDDDMTWGADDAHDVLEARGLDVRVSDDYAEWTLDDDAESVAVAGLREALAEVTAILDRAAAA